MATSGGRRRATSGTSPKARPTPPIAALLFAPASVLAFMAFNLNQTSFGHVAPTLVGATAFAALTWGIVAALRRRADAAAATIAAVWVIVALYYVTLFTALNARLGGGYPMTPTLPFAAAGLVAATWLLARFAAACGPIHIVLSAVAAVMLATPLWRATEHAWRNADAMALYDPELAMAEIAEFLPPVEPGGARPPDVFHFVFDRFASNAVLERHYGVRSETPDFLAAQGFYVAPDSRSNYLKTGHSLASTFYMDYLDLLSGPERPAGSNWLPIFAMLDDHRVGRILKRQGYEIVQFGGWWTGTHDSRLADVNRPHGFDEFAMYYLRRTALRTLVGVAPDLGLSRRLDWDNGQCGRVAAQIAEIKAIAATSDRPLYVFAHFLLPHDPYVFATDGRCVPVDESIARGKPQGYLDQLVYADRVIAEIVPALLARDPQPVVLIQADEGPFPERDYATPWQEAPVAELDVKTGILNAFYFPDRDYAALSPGVSPVNAYRILFDKYLGASFPRLEDRVFAFPTDAALYEFHDVTARLAGPAPAADAPAPPPAEAEVPWTEEEED